MEIHNLFALNETLLRSFEIFKAEFEKFEAEYSSKLGITAVNAQDAFGLTLLQHAVTRSRLDVIEFLIEQGANPEIKDFSGKTAIDMARKDGKLEILAALRKTQPLQIVEPESDAIVPFQQEKGKLQQQPQQQQLQR